MSILWVQGHTYTQLPLILKQSSTAALDLTGVAANGIVVKVRRKDGRQPTSFTALAGSVSITTAASGSISYQFAAADVAQSGDYQLLVQVTMPNSAVWKNLPVDFTILPG